MARTYGQYCGVATALELVGERWALLIVRDLLVGPRRYTDLKQGLPRIPTNILSTRLKELQDGGVVRRVHLAHCGLVYELTDFGRNLDEVVLALGRWGFSAMGAPEPGDVMTTDSLTVALRTAFRPAAAALLDATVYDLNVGPVALRARVSAAGLGVSPRGAIRAVDRPDADPGRPADLAFATGPALHDLISGTLAPSEAITRGVVDILFGSPALLDRFAVTFHLPSPQLLEPLPLTRLLPPP